MQVEDHRPPQFGRRSQSANATPIHARSQAQSLTTTPRTPGKLSDLLSFISEKEHDTPSPSMIEESKQCITPSLSRSSSLSSPVFSIASVIDSLKTKIATLNTNVTSLQTQLASQSEAHQQSLSQQSKQHAAAVAALKAKYEATLTSQLKFIDTLVDEKKSLIAANESHGEKSTALELVYMQKCIDMQLAYDRRISEWQTEYQIKQAKLTKASQSKLLTSEVERLNAQHNEAMQQLLYENESKVVKVKEENALNLRRILLDEKSSQSQELAALSRAKDSEAAARVTSMVEQHRQELKDQQIKYEKEIEKEKSKFEKYQLQEGAKLEHAVLSVNSEHVLLTESIKANHQRQLDAVARSHDAELAELKSLYEKNKVLLEQQAEAAARQRYSERETQLRQALTAERDQQIELIVERLGDENIRLQKQEKSRWEAKFRQLTDEHQQQTEASKRDHDRLADNVSLLTSELEQTKQTLAELQQQLKSRSASESQCHQDSELLNQRCCQYESKLALLSDQLAAAHNEHRDKIVQLGEQHQQAQTHWQRELMHRLSQQQAELTLANDRELAAIQQRVSATIAKKDSVLAKVQHELRQCQARMIEMQTIIAEQKAELLSIG